jgi:hypothetical protein
MKKAVTPKQKAREFRPSTTREELNGRLAQLATLPDSDTRDHEVEENVWAQPGALRALYEGTPVPDVGPGQLRAAPAALQFMLAGCATLTLRSQRTSTRYTYKVSRAKDDYGTRGTAPTWFVSLLSGPDNEGDYTYLGIIRDNVFRLTAKSRLSADTPSVKAFAWTFAKLMTRQFPAELEMWHEGRCGRCGRKLTVPESIAAGIGPECAGRLGC